MSHQICVCSGGGEKREKRSGSLRTCTWFKKLCERVRWIVLMCKGGLFVLVAMLLGRPSDTIDFVSLDGSERLKRNIILFPSSPPAEHCRKSVLAIPRS